MTERTEERLRAAMHAEADEIEASDDAWEQVQRRVRAAHPRRAVRYAVFAAAAAIVAVAAIGVVVVRDDTSVDVVPADSTTTVTTAPVTPPTTAVTAAFDGIWPFATQAQVDAYLADPGAGTYLDPEQTAVAFAREYLGMPAPASATGFHATAGDSGTVEITPQPGSPMTTTIHVHRYGGTDGVYSVDGTQTKNIVVDPASLAEVSGTTIPLVGESSAFEAVVNVDVRQDGGRTLGSTTVMGGGGPELAPFTGEVTIEQPTEPVGAIVFKTLSAKDGSVAEATVVHTRFVTVAGTSFAVFFHRGETLVPVPRHGDATSGVLRQALDALVAGPRPEDGDGLTSLFSSDTADVIAGVNLRDGTAIVDLARTVNNASTSAGSKLFLDELNATVFQFLTVDRVEYRLGGSCDAFWTWLQYGSCRVVDRPASSG